MPDRVPNTYILFHWYNNVYTGEYIKCENNNFCTLEHNI